MTDGMLLVISAPSGCGKTTILKKVMADLSMLVFSVSHTTRSPRRGEADGRDYHFVSKEVFHEISNRDPSGFLEWAEVHGNFYGTGKEEVARQRRAGYDVVLDIDVQGVVQICENSDPVTVFIAPPSLDELENRLRGRGTESAETMAVRLANAEKEMVSAASYDYLIVNDRLVEAVESLRSIIIAERCRQRRSIAGLPVWPLS